MRGRQVFLLMMAGGLALAAAASGTASGAAFVSLGDWRRAADGSSLTVTVDGRRLRLALEENPLLTPGAAARLGRRGTDAASIRTLRGSVVGESESLVRVALANEWAAGYVIAGDRSYEIVPLPGGSRLRPEPQAGLRAGIVDEEPRSRPSPEQPAAHTFGCDSLTPHALASASGLVAGWATRDLQMAVAVDSTFVAANADWAAAAAALINGVDGIFQSEVDVNIVVVDLHSHPSSQLTASGAGGLLGQLIAHYALDHSGLAREDTALVVGKVLTGGVLGQASCVGAAGDPNLAYQVSTTVGLDPDSLLGLTTFYTNAYVKAAAHELGHIFDAHHHYANCAEAGRAPVPDACTLMFNFANFFDEEMSTLERLVMRGWAESFI